MSAPNSSPRALRAARIVEENCIGCTLCIKACPVDCIIGAHKLLHTVLRGDCIGCKLCIPVCPTDCIILHTAADIHPPFSPAQKTTFRRRARSKRNRERRAQLAREAKQQARDKRRMHAEIAAAVARTTARINAAPKAS